MSVYNSAVEPEEGQDATPEVLPAAPPAEVTEAIDIAFERTADLAAADRELHFAVDGTGALGIEVRDLAGQVIRSVSPSQALGLMDEPDLT